MKRKIITIDENRCTGCALCIPNCPEGAIQIIDGKARLVSDLMCDGLGACLGHCPEGAITIEEREADAYDEVKVMGNIIKAGPNTIKAHLKHLHDHNEQAFLDQALQCLTQQNIPIPDYAQKPAQPLRSGCPGSQSMTIAPTPHAIHQPPSAQPSQLGHWPVQMHLISPNAPHYRGSDMALAADCTAFACASFHNELLKGKTLAIACPKLDDGLGIYQEKIRLLIDEAHINTLTIITMMVPCCAGLISIAQKAAQQASRKVPLKSIVLNLQGNVITEQWL